MDARGPAPARRARPAQCARQSATRPAVTPAHLLMPLRRPPPAKASALKRRDRHTKPNLLPGITQGAQPADGSAVTQPARNPPPEHTADSTGLAPPEPRPDTLDQGVWRLDIEQDGMCTRLFNLLWTRTKLHPNGCPNLRVPQTLIVDQFRPDQWYFWSTSGYVMKKLKNNLVLEEVYNKFMRAHELQKHKCDIVAYLIHTDIHPVTGKEAAFIEYMDESELRNFCDKRNKPKAGILQEFRPPRGSNNIVYRAMWSPTVVTIEARKNMHALDKVTGLRGKRYHMYERASTFEKMTADSQVSEFVSVNRKISEQIQGLTNTMAAHVEMATGARYRPTQIISYFKVDEKENVWYLFSSSVRVRSKFSIGPLTTAVPLYVVPGPAERSLGDKHHESGSIYEEVVEMMAEGGNAKDYDPIVRAVHMQGKADEDTGLISESLDAGNCPSCGSAYGRNSIAISLTYGQLINYFDGLHPDATLTSQLNYNSFEQKNGSPSPRKDTDPNGQKSSTNPTPMNAAESRLKPEQLYRLRRMQERTAASIQEAKLKARRARAHGVEVSEEQELEARKKSQFIGRPNPESIMTGGDRFKSINSLHAPHQPLKAILDSIWDEDDHAREYDEFHESLKTIGSAIGRMLAGLHENKEGSRFGAEFSDSLSELYTARNNSFKKQSHGDGFDAMAPEEIEKAVNLCDARLRMWVKINIYDRYVEPLGNTELPEHWRNLLVVCRIAATEMARQKPLDIIPGQDLRFNCGVLIKGVIEGMMRFEHLRAVMLEAGELSRTEKERVRRSQISTCGKPIKTIANAVEAVIQKKVGSNLDEQKDDLKKLGLRQGSDLSIPVLSLKNLVIIRQATKKLLGRMGSKRGSMTELCDTPDNLLNISDDEAPKAVASTDKAPKLTRKASVLTMEVSQNRLTKRFIRRTYATVPPIFLKLHESMEPEDYERLRTDPTFLSLSTNMCGSCYLQYTDERNIKLPPPKMHRDHKGHTEGNIKSEMSSYALLANYAAEDNRHNNRRYLEEEESSEFLDSPRASPQRQFKHNREKVHKMRRGMAFLSGLDINAESQARTPSPPKSRHGRGPVAKPKLQDDVLREVEEQLELIDWSLKGLRNDGKTPSKKGRRPKSAHAKVGRPLPRGFSGKKISTVEEGRLAAWRNDLVENARGAAYV